MIYWLLTIVSTVIAALLVFALGYDIIRYGQLMDSKYISKMSRRDNIIYGVTTAYFVTVASYLWSQ